MGFSNIQVQRFISYGTDLVLHLSERVGKVLSLAGQWLYFSVAFLTHTVTSGDLKT